MNAKQIKNIEVIYIFPIELYLYKGNAVVY
jgi:hypothetical protein